MFQCLSILKNPFTSSNIQHISNLNMPHVDGLPLAYGSRVQYFQTEPDLPTLDPVGTQRVQFITGTLIYYF